MIHERDGRSMQRWNFIGKLARDLIIAQANMERATHIKDHQRWFAVTQEIANDIARARLPEWRP